MKKKMFASWIMAGLVALGSPLAVTADTHAILADTLDDAVIAQATEQIIRLTRAEARKELLELPVIKQARRDQQEAFEAWYHATGRAELLDTEKVTFENPFTGNTEAFIFDDKTQLMRRYQKFLEPEQRKLAYDVAIKMTSVTIANLENAMDMQLVGLWSAQNEVLAKERARRIAMDSLDRALASQAAGRVTQLAVDEVELEWIRADNAVAAAKRTRENRIRSLNHLLGASIDREVEVVVSPNISLPALGADDYVAQALENRVELTRIRGSIQLKEQQLEMMTFRSLHIEDEDIASDYTRIGLELALERMQLDDAISNISAEIRAAHSRLRFGQLDILTIQENRRRQESQLDVMQKRVLAGSMPLWTTDNLADAVTNMATNEMASRLSLEMEIRRFRRATLSGPAIGG